MLMNLHTHTLHSPDGEDTVSERVAEAKRLGLRYMAVTDHVELNRFLPASEYGAVPSVIFDYDSRKVFEDSLADVTEQKSRCEGLTLLCGAEFGQIPCDIALGERLYADPRLDLVIGSVHELPGMPDFYFINYNAVDTRKLITEYFEEVLRLARTDCYDILGHLTYALRYLPRRADYDISPHLPVIDEIYRVIIAKGKALELNGSMLKKPDGVTDPDFALLKRYRAAGGRLLTISTDAHHMRYLGYKVNDLEQMARDAGFEELTVYQKHQPVAVALPKTD